MPATCLHAGAILRSQDRAVPQPRSGDVQPGHPQHFNRYWYAAGNPYKYIDPTGRDIDYVLKNGATDADKAATMNYLKSSPTAQHEISQLENSKQTYTISFDRSETVPEYHYKTRTITINPTKGIVVESSGKIESAAMVAGHEISHAAEHDRIGTKAFKQNLMSPVISSKQTSKGLSTTYGVSPEEKRATTVERQIAHELGTNVRQNYRDVKGAVTTCSPTSTSKC